MSKQKTAIVVGAGVGGIASAARLAKAGFAVTVLEKNAYTGGRCSLIHSNGYRFDQGPSLLLLPHFFEETFHDLDTSLKDEGVELYKCEPNYNVWFGDGEKFELSTDISRMKTEIERWEGKDGFERYLAFMVEAHRHYELSVTHVLRNNFTSLLSMARPSFLKHLFALHPLESIYDRASKYFWTERLRRVFTFGSMYMGMSPFDAPGTYSLLQYTELAEGIWYPKVSKINVSASGVATGVTLQSGETLGADVILINADLVYAYNHLLPPSSKAKALSKKAASCSSISFYWAMDRKISELHTHNVFLANEYRDSFDDIFKRQLIPKEPSFYVNVPSRVDHTAAPEEKDAIVVLVPVGHLLEDGASEGLDSQLRQDWNAMVSKAREAVLTTVERRTGANIRQHITKEILNTPATWKAEFNLDKGAILGLSHSFFNVLSFRPSTRHASIRDLYFVGASTHPGTGVPIVLAGSKVTTNQILDDLSLQKPWTSGVHITRNVSATLDRPLSRPFDLLNVMICMALLALAAAYYTYR